jgi:hypothetical protein
MKRLALLSLFAGILLASVVLGISQARADDPNATLVQLNCDNGQSFQTTLPPFGEAVTIIGSTSNYIPVNLSYTDASGTTHLVFSSHADPRGQPLVTCHSVGPVTGKPLHVRRLLHARRLDEAGGDGEGGCVRGSRFPFHIRPLVASPDTRAGPFAT